MKDVTARCFDLYVLSLTPKFGGLVKLPFPFSSSLFLVSIILRLKWLRFLTYSSKMLASPILPKPPNGHGPVHDITAFNNLLPPAVEFVEGSSSGTLAVPEGKYEPINGTPRLVKTDSNSVRSSATFLVLSRTDLLSF